MTTTTATTVRAPLRRPFASQAEQDEAIRKHKLMLGTENKEEEGDKKSDGEKEKENAKEEEEEEDEEQRELAKLKCASVPTEEVASREKARQEREERRRQSRMSSDYPGLAFGSAGMFGGSDTMMKFSVIKNELHNIMRSQLRRVDGEVSAMAQRVRRLDENLERSERHIREATAALAEAARYEVERRAGEEEGEDGEGGDALSRFDAQLRLLEGKLVQARALAAEAKQQQQGQ